MHLKNCRLISFQTRSRKSQSMMRCIYLYIFSLFLHERNQKVGKLKTYNVLIWKMFIFMCYWWIIKTLWKESKRSLHFQALLDTWRVYIRVIFHPMLLRYSFVYQLEWKHVNLTCLMYIRFECTFYREVLFWNNKRIYIPQWWELSWWWLRYSGRVSTSCSTSGIRRDGDSGILEGYPVPAPLVAFVVMVSRVFWKGK
jgi:hypothetical protein